MDEIQIATAPSIDQKDIEIGEVTHGGGDLADTEAFSAFVEKATSPKGTTFFKSYTLETYDTQDVQDGKSTPYDQHLALQKGDHRQWYDGTDSPDQTELRSPKGNKCLKCIEIPLTSIGLLLFIVLLLPFAFIMGSAFYIRTMILILWNDRFDKVSTWNAIVFNIFSGGYKQNARPKFQTNVIMHLKHFPYRKWFLFISSNPSFDMCIWRVVKTIPPVLLSLVFGPYIFYWILKEEMKHCRNLAANANPDDNNPLLILFNRLSDTPLGQVMRRSVKQSLFCLDVVTDCYLMYYLYEYNRFYFGCSLSFIVAANFVPWARTITLVKDEYYNNFDATGTTLSEFAILFYLIPWTGVVLVLLLDLGLALNTVLDWFRLAKYGQPMEYEESIESYMVLRSITELMCESIPQLCLQGYLFFTVPNVEAELKIEEWELYLSIAASIANIFAQFFTLRAEAKKSKGEGLIMYMFSAMEGRFQFIEKILRVESGWKQVDYSKYVFNQQGFNRYSIPILARALDNPDVDVKRITLSPRTLSKVNVEGRQLFVQACRKNEVRIHSSVEMEQWLTWQRGSKYIIPAVVPDPANGDIPILHVAVEAGDKNLVRNLLEQNLIHALAGCDPNEPGIDNNSALYYAVIKKDQKMVELLLSNGANINHRNALNRTTLWHASMKTKSGELNDMQDDYLEMTKFLLGKGADVNIVDEYNSHGILLHSIMTKKRAVTNLVLHHDSMDTALLNRTNRFNATALIFAASFADEALCRLLIDKGADVNLQNEDGYTALMKACPKIFGNLNLLKENLHKQTTWRENTILALLEAKADIDMQNEAGETALVECCRHRRLDLAKILLEKGASINVKKSRKEKFFHYRFYEDVGAGNAHKMDRSNWLLFDAINSIKIYRHRHDGEWKSFFDIPGRSKNVYEFNNPGGFFWKSSDKSAKMDFERSSEEIKFLSAVEYCEQNDMQDFLDLFSEHTEKAI